MNNKISSHCSFPILSAGNNKIISHEAASRFLDYRTKLNKGVSHERPEGEKERENNQLTREEAARLHRELVERLREENEATYPDNAFQVKCGFQALNPPIANYGLAKVIGGPIFSYAKNYTFPKKINKHTGKDNCVIL